MHIFTSSLVVLALTLANGCQATPHPGSVPTSMRQSGATVRVQLGQQRPGMSVQAAAKTTADIDKFYLRLVNTETGWNVAQGTSGVGDCRFVAVPDGTYRLEADALDASGTSIVEGGAQLSRNTVTVMGDVATYSDGGAALQVELQLLNETP